MFHAMRPFLLCLLLLNPLHLTGDDFLPRAANGGQLIMHGVPEIPAELVARISRYQDVRSATLARAFTSGRSSVT
jgi:hypothetical protein